MFFKIRKIPKGNGKFRTIYIPRADLCLKLQSYLPYLELQLEKHRKVDVNYAFEKNKNCALGALKHIGYEYTLSLDITDFFDSITEKHLARYIRPEVLSWCLINGSPRQGLCTSPLLSCIAFIDLDEKIDKTLKKFFPDVVFTRYADDMYFSFNYVSYSKGITELVRKILSEAGFELNPSKTTFQHSKGGNRVITGISVSSNSIQPTRKIKKKMRAAAHQNNKQSLAGLKDWSLCKIPKKI